MRKHFRNVKEFLGICVFLPSNLGLWQTFHYLRMRIAPPKQPFWLHSRRARFPLLCRPGTSDMAVFGQIFAEREYAIFRAVKNARFIVDCGANVGYSSAYFLSEFPNARVLAIEPDPENFALCQKNLEPYGERAQVVRAGIWERTGSLQIAAEPYRDGRAWAVQVRHCDDPAGSDLPAVDIPWVMEQLGCERIDILKIDVEGAEVVVFRDASQWIGRVDNLAVELHEDTVFGPAAPVYHAALEGQGFRQLEVRELNVAMRKPR